MTRQKNILPIYGSRYRRCRHRSFHKFHRYEIENVKNRNWFLAGLSCAELRTANGLFRCTSPHHSPLSLHLLAFLKTIRVRKTHAALHETENCVFVDTFERSSWIVCVYNCFGLMWNRPRWQNMPHMRTAEPELCLFSFEKSFPLSSWRSSIIKLMLAKNRKKDLKEKEEKKLKDSKKGKEDARKREKMHDMLS